MFWIEYDKARQEKWILLYLLPGILISLLALAQFRAVLSNMATSALSIEALYLTVLAVGTGAIGLCIMVFAAQYATQRFSGLPHSWAQYFWTTAAVITKISAWIIPLYLLFWLSLSCMCLSSGIQNPEWSLVFSCWLRCIFFTLSLVALGTASGKAFSYRFMAALMPLVLLAGFNSLIKFLAYRVTPYAIYFSPFDTYTVWISGYRLQLLATWQAGVFWLGFFLVFILLFVQLSARRDKITK